MRLKHSLDKRYHEFPLTLSMVRRKYVVHSIVNVVGVLQSNLEISLHSVPSSRTCKQNNRGVYFY